jgi:hypothetical protein
VDLGVSWMLGGSAGRYVLVNASGIITFNNAQRQQSQGDDGLWDGLEGQNNDPRNDTRWEVRVISWIDITYSVVLAAWYFSTGSEA